MIQGDFNQIRNLSGKHYTQAELQNIQNDPNYQRSFSNSRMKFDS